MSCNPHAAGDLRSISDDLLRVSRAACLSARSCGAGRTARVRGILAAAATALGHCKFAGMLALEPFFRPDRALHANWRACVAPSSDCWARSHSMYTGETANARYTVKIFHAAGGARSEGRGGEWQAPENVHAFYGAALIKGCFEGGGPAWVYSHKPCPLSVQDVAELVTEARQASAFGQTLLPIPPMRAPGEWQTQVRALCDPCVGRGGHQSG